MNPNLLSYRLEQIYYFDSFDNSLFRFYIHKVDSLPGINGAKIFNGFDIYLMDNFFLLV